MWLAISLSLVGLALVLFVIAGLSAWRRWQKMRQAGSRFSRRVSALSAEADAIASRLQEGEGLRAATERESPGRVLSG